MCIFWCTMHTLQEQEYVGISHFPQYENDSKGLYTKVAGTKAK